MPKIHPSDLHHTITLESPTPDRVGFSYLESFQISPNAKKKFGGAEIVCTFGVSKAMKLRLKNYHDESSSITQQVRKR